MEVTRESVIEWLSKEHRSQSWLASQCDVSKQAVSNWLREKKPQAISAAAEIIIRQLMEEDAARDQAKPPHNLVLEFGDEEYEPVEKAALEHGMTIREWAKRILNEAATMGDDEFLALFSKGKLVQFPKKAHLEAAAGSPIGAEVTDWNGDDDTVRVKINGLSMIPLLDDGDIVAMRHKKASRSPYMKKGLIYLVAYDDGYTVKEYNTRTATDEEKGEEWVEKGKVKILKSLNPEYPEIIIKQPIEWIAWLDPKNDL